MTRADTLLQIKDAESKAAQIVKDAQEKQRAIVANARRDAVKRIQDAEVKMREENDRAFNSERAKVTSTKTELINKGAEEARLVKSGSASKKAAVRAHLKDAFEKSL
ncbi:MAG: hypothetical protein A4E32_00649 [Methanomassiliicoccales archaeon PtaU1.Bin124]|nr:MAG: hypothetical protein A4E32_00649 [Methanomassiliicoccales archaeon PtaU1.Bin124]